MINFYSIEQFIVLYDFRLTKCYFGILDNLYLRQKVNCGSVRDKNFSFCDVH